MAKEEVKEELLEEEVQEEEPQKKGPLGKLKDAILPDPEEQAAIISTFVRITVLGLVGWNIDFELCCHTRCTTTENRSNFYSFGFYWSFS